MGHIPVLLSEILSFAPNVEDAAFLDVTAGGGGHFFAILEARKTWRGQCWDRDPAAADRIQKKGAEIKGRFSFCQKCFSVAPSAGESFDLVLADLGISSFQIDDEKRGLSFYSAAPLDFRMNPAAGEDFGHWLARKKANELEDILIKFGEEKNYKKIAQALKKLSAAELSSAKSASEFLLRELHLFAKAGSLHPLTRTFQALRIAVNDELGELQSFLEWAPRFLRRGGRLAIISFHSLEDRKVKRAFAALSGEAYKILTPKALTPGPEEVLRNPRSRSAKLRVLERTI